MANPIYKIKQLDGGEVDWSGSYTEYELGALFQNVVLINDDGTEYLTLKDWFTHYSSLISSYADTMTAISALQTNIDDILDTADSAVEKTEVLQEQITAAEADIDALESKTATLETNVEALQAKTLNTIYQGSETPSDNSVSIWLQTN